LANGQIRFRQIQTTLKFTEIQVVNQLETT
jgi:hypothetical protein